MVLFRWPRPESVGPLAGLRADPLWACGGLLAGGEGGQGQAAWPEWGASGWGVKVHWTVGVYFKHIRWGGTLWPVLLPHCRWARDEHDEAKLSGWLATSVRSDKLVIAESSTHLDALHNNWIYSMEVIHTYVQTHISGLVHATVTIGLWNAFE